MAQLPGGLFGLIGMERDGLLTLERGGTPPDPDEKSEIVIAVLVHEARNARGAVCVELADEGEALASERREIATIQRAVADADPASRARLIAELDRRRNPTRSWQRIPPPGSNEAAPLGAENARQLQSAETAILGMPTSGRVDMMLDMGLLPEILRARPPGCDGLLFTAPAVAGNIAFVETVHTCGGPEPGLCASGQIYALSRSGGRWRVEAMASTWIS